MLSGSLIDAFSQTLLGGKYNLLLGAGISRDSTNAIGETLPSGDFLREKLCVLKGLPPSTSLPRVAALLTPQERQAQLVDRFAGCKPHPSLFPMSRFLWHRLFTFNIDDVLESLYENDVAPKQSLVPINFDASFEPTPEMHELQAVHLHGWSRSPGSGFVFSYAEYARVMATLNPWMHLLSEIIATEPFIIAGTSLNEMDLEYYLNHRNGATPRRGRGPSLLIDPKPDAATVSDCARFGLTLVTGTFAEFLSWIANLYPAPPTVQQLIVPDVKAIFPENKIEPRQLLRFFSDFRLATSSHQVRSKSPSPFLYGRSPQQNDLDQHLDIPRFDSTSVLKTSQDMLKSLQTPSLVLVMDEAGVGKTTILHRAAHDLASQGRTVLVAHASSRLDVRAACHCIGVSTTPLVLVVDGLADHVEQVLDIVRDPLSYGKVIVLASERSYRREHIDQVLGDWPRRNFPVTPLSLDERQQLIELLRQYGLAGSYEVKRSSEFAKKLDRDPIAVAVCRILNDFRPLDAIVDSLWNASTPEHRIPYLCVTIARHCLSVGLRYSVLQAAMGPKNAVSDMFTDTVSLRLADHAEDDDYVVPLNAVIGERVLEYASRKARDLVFDSFLRIATSLSPHVNRFAIMRRTPEARLATRLFDADKVARPMLGKRTEEWYIACQKHWEWNSRYWEQRALLVSVTNAETALRYARHAVALERHPFTLTTLGKMIFLAIERGSISCEIGFAEAFDVLTEAIYLERGWARATVHPFATLFSGTCKHLESKLTLSTDERADLVLLIAEARYKFASDKLIQNSIRRLENLLA